MTDEPASVVAADKIAEAAVVDTATQAAQQASNAAQAAIASAGQVAAVAEATAAERVEEIAERTGEELAKTEGELSWLKTHAAETQTALQNQYSALTSLAETQSRQGEMVTAIAAKLDQLLTPPKPEAEPAAEPAQAKESVSADVPPEAEKTEPPRRRHRSI